MAREGFLRLPSPAKINLGLRIIGKRPDGYHEIETVLQMIGLWDSLTFILQDEGIELICQGRGPLPAGRDNLIYRAAELLRERTGVGRGVKIVLEKRIPLMAGLGGGSSNAAMTLLALNRLWDLGLKGTDLSELALSLGADVPFFLNGPRAYATGRGEQLQPLPSTHRLHILLVKPPISVSTAWAYRILKLSLTKERHNIKIISDLIEQGRVLEIGDYLYNDLEETIISHYPVIGEIKKDLLRQGALGAQMSGSGPTVFGVFPTRQLATEAAGPYSRRGMDAFVVDTIRDIEEVRPGLV